MGEIITPVNVEIVFEHYCKGCTICEPVIVKIEFGDKEIQRVTCNNTQICQKVRTMAATEKAKEYPFV